jgi:hypothetical protein
MDKLTRNAIERATQQARNLLDDDFSSQLEGTFDVLRSGVIAAKGGVHLSPRQLSQRDKIVAAIEHKRATDMTAMEAVTDYIRDAAFTTLNRFVALKMLEARQLVQECITKGEQSAGYREFCGMAPGLALLPDAAGYRLYIESLFDEFSTEIRILFDRRDSASVLWPKRQTFDSLLGVLNAPDLSGVWQQDETIGWLYQFYNREDERKKMREESSAPRNSRELAVRNQFFTPRFVVEFLIENTLGRLWYEMTRGQTSLKEQCCYLLRQPTEVFLKPGEILPKGEGDGDTKGSGSPSEQDLPEQTVHIPHRPLKDPREIRLLDPACGSMHFGLYAFDLFAVIYDEAWEIVHGSDDAAKSAESFTQFVIFANSFPDKTAFLREVPRLILEHNIYGIDIDPRAVQIAGLSLWLRVQRAWQQAGVKSLDRPPITRSNLVCAQPMPGKKELLREFVEQQFPAGERAAFAFLLEEIFDRMTLAGEAGSLLRIEEEIRDCISKARALARSQSVPRQALLFSSDERPVHTEFDLRGLNDDQFWQASELRIYEALKTYAEQAENGGGFPCRLFADDAAQGFAFIDVCRKRYDVVVMNPPFGLSQSELYKYLNRKYPDSFIDLLASFIVRGETLAPSGFIGAITSRACLYTKTLLDWRKEHISGRISALADLGIGVLDGAMVRACAYVIPVGAKNVNGCFIDARKTEDKGPAILTSVRAARNGDVAGAPIYSCDSAFFALIPQHRILYWLPRKFWQQVRSLPAIEPLAATIRAGLTTYDDERFLRLRWEVSAEETGVGKTWVFLSKGGYFSTFYNDVHLVVLWANSGREVGAYNRSLYDTDAQSRRGSTFYLRPAVTYSRRTDYFSARALPENCFFSDKGPCIIPLNKTTPEYLLGVFNADLLRGLVHAQSQGGCFETGVLKFLPWSEPDDAVQASVQSAAQAAWRTKAQVFSTFETDARFISPILASGDSIAACHSNSVQVIVMANSTVASSAAAISSTISMLFGLTNNNFEDLDVFESDHEIKEAVEFVESPVVLATALLSYAFGSAFGRWDIRYATGERSAPDSPTPFAALPVCPPGMLQGDNGLSLPPEAGRQLWAEERYPLDVAWDGILVDDPEHPLDLERRVHAVLAVLWRENVDALEHEACGLLGVSTLREWFRRSGGFFANHLKRYSKSRRKAPIYWPLSTASGSYTIWLYYHRLAGDTLYRALELAKEKLQFEEVRLSRARTELGANPKSAERKALEVQEIFVAELRTFNAELVRVAPIWKPNLNDGAIINYAPLWRLIGAKSWQKDVTACWNQLVAGELDWSQIAMHLWPERVIAKCTGDRSVAIAHGLEDVFWAEGHDGKWKPRQIPTQAIDELVREQTSIAVKSALNSLLDAPDGSASGRRGRGRRATRAASVVEED